MENSTTKNTNLLALAVGLFLVLSGAQTLIDFNTDLAKAARVLVGWIGNNQLNDILVIAIASFKLAVGSMLVIKPLGILSQKLNKIFFWLATIGWLAILVYTNFFSIQLWTPTVFIWIQQLVTSILVFAAIWTTKPE